MKLKAISPIVSMVVIVVLVFIVAGIVVPWYYNLARSITNSTGTSALRDVECSSAALDFDTSYGNSGVSWNFTGANDTLSVKVVNTGTITLYNFSIQAAVNKGTSVDMEELAVNATTQRSSANPLKPGQSEVLIAVVAEDINGTLTEVRVMNEVCRNVVAKQDM